MEPIFQSISILANPLPISSSLPQDTPVFGPLQISLMEGLLLGIILWRWTQAKPTVVLWGFLINIATLTLFWSALRGDGNLYDYQIVVIGELLVWVVEAVAIALVVRSFARVATRSIWWKAFGISLVLNVASLLAGALITTRPIL